MYNYIPIFLSGDILITRPTDENNINILNSLGLKKITESRAGTVQPLLKDICIKQNLTFILAAPHSLTTVFLTSFSTHTRAIYMICSAS